MAILHKNISAEGDIHNPKWFSGANNGDVSWRNELGVLESTDELVLPAALDFVDGSAAPPTSNSGDIYVLSSGASVNAGWGTVALGDWVRYDGTTWNDITPQKSTLCYNETLDALISYTGSAWVAIGGDSIYTADGTLTGNRVVGLDSNKLTINPTTGTTTNLNGCNVSLKTSTGVKGVSNNGTNALTIFDINENFLWIFKDNGDAVTETGKLAIGAASNPYGSIFSVKGKTILQAKNAGSAFFGGWTKSDGSSITAVYEDGSFLIGNYLKVGSEDISLQGQTSVKGIGTAGSSALSIYDNDTTPTKLWDFLDNGNVELGGDSVINQDGNLLTFNSGTTAVGGIYGLTVDATGLTGSSNATSIFNIEGKDGNYLNMSNEGNVQFRSYKSTLIASFLSGDGTKGLSLSPQNGGISRINTSFLQFRGKSTDSFYTQFYHTSSTADFQMYSTGDVIQHRINVSGTGGIIQFFKDGIKSGGFIVGSGGKIASEDISLQGDTLLNAKVSMPNLPTSATGLTTGDLWNDGGTLKIA
tara:strand:- start:436 stop:2025 length:1590 start_codon:yes stop_codon:yes gene_type:complete